MSDDPSKQASSKNGSNENEKDDMSTEVDPKKNCIVMTDSASYLLEDDWSKRSPFSFKAKRRHDGHNYRIDFERCSDTESAGGKFMTEAKIASLLYEHRDPTLCHYLLTAHDTGCSGEWRFIVLPTYDMSLESFVYRMEKDKSDNDSDKGTLFKIVAQMFLGVSNMHKLGHVHGQLRLENFVIGSKGRQLMGEKRELRMFVKEDAEDKGGWDYVDIGYGGPICDRMILLRDFSTNAPSKRRQEREKDREESGYSPVDHAYSSRHRERGFSVTRKDDIETWLYLSARIFNPYLLPWLPKCEYLKEDKDRKQHQILLKRAFCMGKLWPAMKSILFDEYRQILKLHMEVRSASEPYYEEIWNLLSKALTKRELDPFAPPFQWVNMNRGKLVEYSDACVETVDMDCIDFDPPNTSIPQ